MTGESADLGHHLHQGLHILHDGSLELHVWTHTHITQSEGLPPPPRPTDRPNPPPPPSI